MLSRQDEQQIVPSEFLGVRFDGRNRSTEDAFLFHDVVTIDPSEVDRAWEQLSRDTVALELGMLPKWLHTVLISTLGKEADERGKRER